MKFPDAFAPRFTKLLLLAALMPLSTLQAQSVYATPHTMTLFAGQPGSIGTTDGTGSAARFYTPESIAIDGSGNLYLADAGKCTIRKITPAGVVTTFAGAPDQFGAADGTGSAAQFGLPFGVATDAAGNVYVSDNYYNTIRKITPAGVVTTLAGSPGQAGYADGTGTNARFDDPVGLAVDAAGNVYVADRFYSTIRKITPAGVVTTFAGTAGSGGSADGTGAAASFYLPNCLAVDSAGNIWVGDGGNFTIRKITPGAVVTTFAGTAGSSGSADGTGAAARFYYTGGVAVDSSGTLYVVDSGNNTIRKITSGAVVTTLAGWVGATGFTNGMGSAARFHFSTGVAVDAGHNIYVSEEYNACVRKGVPGGGSNDFSNDGKPDILWQNSTSGDRGFWLMSGTAFTNWVDVGIMPTAWRVAVTADFNADGRPDVLWENTSTGERYIWFMNGTTFTSGFSFGSVSTDWHIAAAADFNGDGKTDILWENTASGDRGFWLLDGTTFVSWLDIGVLTNALKIVGTADFNADGKTDIVWENTSTGKRVLWFMNGTTFTSSFNLGTVTTDWHIAATADYNGDGKPDILWENVVNGDRGFWLMNGTTFSSWVDMGIVGTDWRIAP